MFFESSVLRSVGLLVMIALVSFGCANRNTQIEDLEHPVVFVNSLEEVVQAQFPLSDWGQTRTTLYDPEVEYSHETGGIWIRLKGLTWNWNERRYRYGLSMLTTPEIDTDKRVVYLSPTQEIMWQLDDVPRLYKQQVIDMTYPIIIDTFHDRGFTGVEFDRHPTFPE